MAEKIERDVSEEPRYNKEPFDKVILSIAIFTLIVIALIYYWQTKSNPIPSINEQNQIIHLEMQRDALLKELEKYKSDNKNAE